MPNTFFFQQANNVKKAVESTFQRCVSDGFPANTQRRYNVDATSQRCNDVDATLCVCWVHYLPLGGIFQILIIFEQYDMRRQCCWVISENASSKKSYIRHIRKQISKSGGVSVFSDQGLSL